MTSISDIGLFYTENPGLAIRIAQILGLTSTAFLAGKTWAASFGTASALLLAPAPLLAQQWKEVFDADAVVNPGLSLVGMGVCGWLGYREPNPRSRPQILYFSAAAALASVIPYSLLFLHPVSEKLVRKAKEYAGSSVREAVTESGEETTHALVDQWATVNLGRTVLSGIAAVLGLWAALDRREVVPAVGKLVGGADRMGR